MSYRTGTATDHADLFAKLRTFLTDPVGSNGCGWTENRYDGTNKRLEVTGPGLDDAQEINVNLNLYENVGADTFAIGVRMSPDWQAGLAYNAQTNQSVETFHPIWNASMTYWFIGSKARAIVITKVSTVFSAMYVGRFLPYGSAGEYGLPWYVGGTVQASSTRWSSTSESSRNFWDPTTCYLMDPGGAWRLVRNFYENTGEQAEYSYINVWPYLGSITSNQSASARFRELRENVDGTYPLFPLILHGGNPNYEIYGELDGVYAIPAFSAGSEDTITIGGDTYLVVQNLHRTARYYYAAVKLA